MADTVPESVAGVPLLLPVATVAGLLHRSPRTVRRRITEGLLPAVIEGDQTMVRADELRAYIEGLNRVGTSEARTRNRRASQADYDFLG